MPEVRSGGIENDEGVDDDAWCGLPLGAVLDERYVVEGRLGAGGMCVVLLARRIHLSDRVAIKVLRARWTDAHELVGRFLREGRSVARLKSEHAVRIFDFGTTPAGAPYLVLEHLEGADLEALLASRGPLPPTTAVDYVLQASEAIAEAHALGIIHRDIKPANLFLSRRRDGSLDQGDRLRDPKIVTERELDASAASPTSGAPRDPSYMPPEQLRSMREVGARPTSGRWATSSSSSCPGAAVRRDDGDRSLRPSCTIPEVLSALSADCPEGLARVVLRCLEKDPSARFPDVRAGRGPRRVRLPAGRESARRIARIARPETRPESERPVVLRLRATLPRPAYPDPPPRGPGLAAASTEPAPAR